MTDENELEGQSRRTFLKTSAAVGATATGITTVGGSAAAQQPLNVNANQIFRQGFIVINGVNLLDVDIGDITVTLQNIDIDVTVEEVLSRNRIRVSDIDISLIEDSVVTVVVNVLSGGTTLVGTDTVRVPNQ